MPCLQHPDHNTHKQRHTAILSMTAFHSDIFSVAFNPYLCVLYKITPLITSHTSYITLPHWHSELFIHIINCLLNITIILLFLSPTSYVLSSNNTHQPYQFIPRPLSTSTQSANDSHSLIYQTDTITTLPVMKLRVFVVRKLKLINLPPPKHRLPI